MVGGWQVRAFYFGLDIFYLAPKLYWVSFDCPHGFDDLADRSWASSASWGISLEVTHLALSHLRDWMMVVGMFIGPVAQPNEAI